MLDDVRFILQDVLGEAETYDDVLEGAQQVCRELLAPLNGPGDAEGATFHDGAVRTPAGFREAYATLINDCIRGDATLFDRADSVEAAWGLVDPILSTWHESSADVTTYPSGSQGPGAADVLIQNDGHHWRTF